MNILVGITGGIAAYKTASIIRLLVKEGHDVRAVMTPMAKQFITPLTIATLCKHPILVDFFSPENGEWNSHVSLGLWSDIMLIAPATANTMAKMANGIADNLLLTTYLSARCPVAIAPSMDLDMYKHPATQENMEKLRARGVQIIEPEDGELASGLVGKGRMAEPEQIVAAVDAILAKGSSSPLNGKRIMLTAGPTYEKMDSVRFIGNYSSGKMGFAIAEELANRGAQVELVAGPVQIKTLNPNIHRHDVESAAQMYEKCCEIFPHTDGAIMTAAVADFTPAECADHKIKRKGPMTLELNPTQDIAGAMGQMKRDGQMLIGFALETNDEATNAQHKLESKNLDFIVLNSLNDKGAGFMHDTNKITIIDRLGKSTSYELKSKKEVAKDIVNYMETFGR
ncbi:MAG: bifunctional phosphopantothenoylcysteine decarboxylase/phosphopantothenate--cysteine ligase CoaBC [Bacteroidia bacterium]|nr:bifunctional phosphopantothenoylcysteine decarboxylase/phosphopantothenate--cysteine ligase CoaBC [Bacteroidia bacterium]